ncbi:transposase [Nocardia sp. NPDC059091]|uniref:transposase n=1 Tax=unclassified Nocardia TaxID=2637762 RepID=UPI00367D64FA
MKLVVPVKLLPTPEQAVMLTATLQTANAAATELAAHAHSQKSRSRAALQRDHYFSVKAAGLSAQPALHVIRKVADAYKTLAANLKAGNYGPSGDRRRERIESTPVRFRADAAQPFDDRCLSWQLDAQTVSIWTVHGGMKNLRYTGSDEQLKTLAQYREGETDLVHRDGMWFLHASCEIPLPDSTTSPPARHRRGNAGLSQQPLRFPSVGRSLLPGSQSSSGVTNLAYRPGS